MYRIKLYDSDNMLCNTIETKKDYNRVVEILVSVKDQLTEITTIRVYSTIKGSDFESYFHIVNL